MSSLARPIKSGNEFIIVTPTDEEKSSKCSRCKNSLQHLFGRLRKLRRSPFLPPFSAHEITFDAHAHMFQCLAIKSGRASAVQRPVTYENPVILSFW